MVKYRASKLTMKDVGVAEEREFLNSNHYQGYIASSWCKGLYDGDTLIELMSFGIPRFNKRYDYELLRLCTLKDCQVYGGASRLLKHFRESKPVYTSILSYCNESKFSGKVYESLGFEKISKCRSYHYEKDGVSYHRSHFQRWKLFQLYPQYGEEYTEKDIMQKEGYTRINEIQSTYKTATSNNLSGYNFKTPESFLSNLNKKSENSVDLSKYKAGVKVFHKKFGEGIINYVEQEGDDLKVDLSFDKVGHKRLMAKFANLEVLD